MAVRMIGARRSSEISSRAVKPILTPHDARLGRVGAVASLLLKKSSVLAGLSAVVLYLCTPTANYYWDGLAFALRIEQVSKHASAASGLFHQNHLLYNAIGYLLYVTPRCLGLSVRALTLLQVASAVSCAMGVGIFFSMARRISSSVYVAAIGAGVLAVSTCWWKAATDADAYSLSVALVLISASSLLSKDPRWCLAGAALAGAMLIHELASLFYPAALVAVLVSNRVENRLRFAVKLSLLTWGLTIASYYTCAALVFGMTRPLDVIKWAGSNPYGVGFSNPLRTLGTFPKYQVDLIFGHSFKAFRRYGGAAELTFAGIGIVAACVAVLIVVRRARIKEGVRSIWRVTPDQSDQWRRIMPVLLTWIGTYALFLLVWEPYVLHYRVYYVPAVVLMFVLMLSNYHRRTSSRPSGAAVIAVIALFFLNLAFFIAPHMRSSSNLLVAAAKEANRQWNEHTVIYFTARGAIDGAFRYFNENTEWRAASPKAIMRSDDEIGRIYDQGGTVWLNDSAVKSVDPEWLSRRARAEEITVKLGDDTYGYVQLLPVK
jgi:hypothetical protein